MSMLTQEEICQTIQFRVLSLQGLKNSGALSFPESIYCIKKQQLNLRHDIRESRSRMVPRAWDEIIMAIEYYT